MASISASCSAAGVCRCAGRVGMIVTNEAIMRASSGSFLARTPLALANCRSLNGLTWRTGTPAASKARMTPRSYPPLASRPIAPIEKQLFNQLGPAGGVIAHRSTFLLGQEHDVQTILRHIDTAKREHCHLRIPLLLMRARARATVRVWKKRPELQAHSRTGIRNGAGFRSRRECGHDPAPVTAHKALFSSYKTPRIHLAAWRRGGRAATKPVTEKLKTKV